MGQLAVVALHELETRCLAKPDSVLVQPDLSPVTDEVLGDQYHQAPGLEQSIALAVDDEHGFQVGLALEVADVGS